MAKNLSVRVIERFHAAAFEELLEFQQFDAASHPQAHAHALAVQKQSRRDTEQLSQVALGGLGLDLAGACEHSVVYSYFDGCPRLRAAMLEQDLLLFWLIELNDSGRAVVFCLSFSLRSGQHGQI